MALQKEIELENGIITKYHRIVSINKITNYQTIIEIASYTNKEKRIEEINALKEGIKKGEAVPTNIFIETTYMNKTYSENETIEDLYTYLKTTDKFKDAIDIHLEVEKE